MKKNVPTNNNSDNPLTSSNGGEKSTYARTHFSTYLKMDEVGTNVSKNNKNEPENSEMKKKLFDTNKGVFIFYLLFSCQNDSQSCF